MNGFHLRFIFSFCIVWVLGVMDGVASSRRSVYAQRPNDAEASYFDAKSYGVKADGRTDVSAALQKAINDVKRTRNFGILFIPEGKYLISRTIYIPSAIRLIGYGKRRPEIILAPRSKGFDQEPQADKGKAKYMFWFTGSIVRDDNHVNDANAGTFYSALSNVDLTISKGNPAAIALRTHFAQHCFISNVSINIGDGKAGMFDLGNEIENVTFDGGQYGIITTKASPGWQVMMTDCSFQGQRKAAIRSQESGLAIVNMRAKNVPTVFMTDDNFWEKVFIENSVFENVSGPAIVNGDENNSNNQINLRKVYCRNVPTLVKFTRSGKVTKGNQGVYVINEFVHGFTMDNMLAVPTYRTDCKLEALKSLPRLADRDVRELPDMAAWHNVRDLGVKGDGTADDTKALQAAIDKYETLYFPQGTYRVTAPLVMRASTKLIGLHPYGTQIFLGESTPLFSGFGKPQAVVVSSKGGDNIINAIGINTGAYNYRAVGIKWMAGEKSLINDVKFVGGHGSMWRPKPGQKEPEWWGGKRRISTPDNPVRAQGKDYAWDNQHWSLWVTDGGGGTFKDIWTANTYATSGIYVEYTSTPSRVYAISIEHHVRNEVRFNNVANWKVYCMQTEEETVESSECQPIEMDDCRDITFANLYMFRVIAVNTPYHSGVRVRGCKDITFLNLHNYAQTLYPNDVAVYDQDKNIEVRPWELAFLRVSGDEASRNRQFADNVRQVASDLDFARGAASDKQGNVYFTDQRMKRIYRWSPDSGLRLVADFPWKPSSLAFDTENRLLVLFQYTPQPGLLINGKQQEAEVLPDSHGTSFSGWGNSGYDMMVYTIDPMNPEETIELLPQRDMASVGTVAKALYPSNRWRDFHDFNEVAVYQPKKCFVAPDGVTIIPRVYDLARTAALAEAIPGKPFYATNEYDARMVKMDVNANGTLSNLKYFAEAGEFGSCVDSEGNVFSTFGNVYKFNPRGQLMQTIPLPERPSTLTWTGAGRDKLFVTSRHNCFVIDMK